MAILLGFVIGLVITLGRESLLPEQYNRDANRIFAIANEQTSTFADPSYTAVGLAYRWLGLGHEPWTAALAGYLLSVVVILVAVHRLGRPRASLLVACFIVATFVLAGVYLGQYSKDVFVLPVVLIALLMPKRVWWDVPIVAAMLAYAYFFRDYWAIIAAAFVGYRLVTLWQVRLRYLFLGGAVASVAVGLAFHFALDVDPNHFRTAVQGKLFANTLIIPLDGGSQPWGGALDVFLNYWLLFIPILLPFTASVAYAAITFAIAFAKLLPLLAARSSIRWPANSRAEGSLARRAIAMLFALAVVQAVFEPDYGSALRHLTPLMPLGIVLMRALRAGTPRVGRTRPWSWSGAARSPAPLETDSTMTPITPPVTMLWLEATRVGSAARTHMDGSRARLDAAGIPVKDQLFSEAATESIPTKIARLARLVLAGRRAAHDGVLIARWHPFLAFVTPVWLRRGGKVLLLVQGNDESTYENNPWLRRIPGIRSLMTRSLRAGSAVLCVNRGLATWVDAQRAGVPGSVAVMPSGVADVFFDAEPADEEEPYVLFFGGLATWQGIDYMLEAHASDDWPDGLRLLVIGDGARAEAVDAAQSDTLRWLGPLPPAELARYVTGALVTLCPKSNTGSMAEVTTPFKMLESAAAGVPVIATDIPAQVQMLEDGGYGVLVSTEEPAELARAVARMASEPAWREEIAARARAFAPRCRWDFAAPQLAAAVQTLQEQIAEPAPRR